MGIDGIGNGGRIPPSGAPAAGGVGGKSPTSPASGAEQAGRAFEVHGERPEAAKTDATQGVAGASSTPLERLRAGEIDVNGYVDLKVDAATKGLHGLSVGELEQIRGVLRHQMAHDPAVMDLVKQATGALPKPDGD